jgi:ABC-2 type transport system permease protein
VVAKKDKNVTAAVRSSLVTESAVLAGRLFTRWGREPMVPIQALLFPSFLLITYDLLIGKSMMRITGTDSIYRLVPMCAVAGAMSAALASGTALTNDRNLGLVSRIWMMPVNRASAMTAMLLAEAARTLLGTALVTAVGFGLGLRFEGGWFAAILFLLVPVLVVVVFSMAVIAIAVRSEYGGMLVWFGMASLGAAFSSAGVPPIETLPTAVQPVTQLNPVLPAVEAMRALSGGESALGPLLLTCTWALGLAAVVGPLAIRGYRAAAESGGL